MDFGKGLAIFFFMGAALVTLPIPPLAGALMLGALLILFGGKKD